MATTYILNTDDRSDYYLIGIEGRFNTTSVMAVRKATDRAVKLGRKVLLFDLTRTTVVDSSGIALLTIVHKQLSSDGGNVCLAVASSAIRKLFEHCGLSRVLRMFGSVEEADLALRVGLATEERGFYVLIKVPREFGVEVVRPMRKAIDESVAAGHTNIVFDLSETETVGSVGIGVLMNVHKRLKPKRGGVHLVAMRPSVRSILEATNVLRVLPEYKTLEQVDERLI